MRKIFTYILWSETIGQFYIGSTADMEDRLRRHNAGYERATRGGVPWVLCWFCEKGSRSEACVLERKLKNLKSHSRIRQFIEKYS